MDISFLRQKASFLGALRILAYAGQQVHEDVRKLSDNTRKGVGSALRAYFAFHPLQIGFILLEVA